MRKLFKIQVLILSLFASSAVFAQKIVETAIVRDGQCYIKRCTGVPDNCNASLHPIYGNSTKKPVKLNRLGSSKQFASMNGHIGSTSTEVFQNLKKTYRAEKSDARELDRLWRAMGYSGFNDPAFTVDRVGGVEEFPAGTTGMIGNGKHTYQYCEFGNAFEGYRIISNGGGCDIYIMKNCGNAFHSHNSALFGYNNCTETLCSPACQTQTISGTQSASSNVGGTFNGTQEIRILARNSGTDPKTKGAVLCLGKVTIPYNASYEIVVNGTATASQSVSVCAENKANVIPITLNLQKGAVNENKVTFGQDGRAYIDVNQKQYKALSSVFTNCCPQDCAAVVK